MSDTEAQNQTDAASSADYRDGVVADPPVQNEAADAEIARREAGEPAPIGPEEQVHINVVEDIISEGVKVAGGPVVEAQPQQDDVDQQGAEQTERQAELLGHHQQQQQQQASAPAKASSTTKK